MGSGVRRDAALLADAAISAFATFKAIKNNN
jgi:hypothetical protein